MYQVHELPHWRNADNCTLSSRGCYEARNTPRVATIHFVAKGDDARQDERVGERRSLANTSRREAELDFEAIPVLNVTVRIVDETVGKTPDAHIKLAIDVT